MAALAARETGVRVRCAFIVLDVAGAGSSNISLVALCVFGVLGRREFLPIFGGGFVGAEALWSFLTGDYVGYVLLDLAGYGGARQTF